MWRELAAISAIVTAVSLVLWWRFLPLPHGDLGFYSEPAYLLARFGKLAAPGSQYVDLTYQRGFYNYPPGYFLVLAAWIKLLGFSPDSLLAFTHLIHSAMLILLYALLRFRYACSRLISSLALVAIFAKIPHGRPDLLACLLSVAAWLALPEHRNTPDPHAQDQNRGRLALSGALAGAALLVSPAFGLAILVTLFILIAIDTCSISRRLKRLALFGSSAFLFFAGIVSIVLWSQHSWILAYVQFTTYSRIRGSQLNHMPALIPYVYLFGIFPFVVLTVLPAIVVVARTMRKPSSTLRHVSLAFLGATLVWFLLNKSQLLLEHHYLFISKTVFLALLCSLPEIPRWLRVLPFLLISVIGFYLYKADYLYIATPLRAEAAVFQPGPGSEREVSVDSLYFTRVYDPDRTIGYETFNIEHYWPRLLAAMPARFKSRLLAGLPLAPAVPDVYLISAFTLGKFGAPLAPNVSCAKPAAASRLLRAFGRRWNLPEDPFLLIACSAAPPNAN